MSTIGSVGCVLVWLSQCVAYIRYHRWFRTHRKELDALIKQGDPNYRRYNRENPNTKERYYSIASPIQPFPAYLGAVLCFLIVFVFSSATLWKNQATVRKVAVAYAGVSGPRINTTSCHCKVTNNMVADRLYHLLGCSQAPEVPARKKSCAVDRPWLESQLLPSHHPPFRRPDVLA